MQSVGEMTSMVVATFEKLQSIMRGWDSLPHLDFDDAQVRFKLLGRFR